jgi:hypothetical protein
MEWLGHELVPFEDVLSQMLDMLKPRNKGDGLRLVDFLVSDKLKIAGKAAQTQLDLWGLRSRLQSRSQAEGGECAPRRCFFRRFV